MGDVARGHDVVVVADHGDRFRLGAAADGVVLADAVAVADPEITALAAEIFVERVAAENGAHGNLVVGAEGGPALDDDVRLEFRSRPDGDVVFDDNELADLDVFGDLSAGGDARGRARFSPTGGRA